MARLAGPQGLQAPPPAARPAPAPRRVPLAIAAISLYWLSLYFYVPVLAPQAHRLGAGVRGVGLVLAAYGFVQFVLRIPTGIWSDRTGRRQPFLVAATAACGVAALGMGVAHTPLLLGLFRGVSGLGACGWVAVSLLFAEFFPPERTAWALGVVSFLATASQLVGMFAGGLLADAGGYALPFLAAAGAAVLGIAAALPLSEPRPAARVAVGLSERLAVGREPRVLAASGLTILKQYVQFATLYGFVPLVATERFGAGGAALGLLSLAGGGPSALASLASGGLAARWSGRTVAIAGFVVAAAGTALLPLAPTLAGLDVAAAIIGVGLGVNAPTLMTAAVEGYGAERRGTAMGFYQAIYAIGMFAGPAVAGSIGHHFGMAGLFESTAVLGAAGAVLSWRWLGRARAA